MLENFSTQCRKTRAKSLFTLTSYIHVPKHFFPEKSFKGPPLKDDIDPGMLGEKNPSEIDKETAPAGEPRLVIESTNEGLMIGDSGI